MSSRMKAQVLSDSSPEKRFEPFELKMRMDGAPPPAIEAFRRNYFMLLEGDSGCVESAGIASVDRLDTLEELHADGTSIKNLLRSTVIIKLNGGLGTSMGLEKAKSLIELKQGLTFLDITAEQIRKLRRRYGASIPLLFMNSYSTDADTRAALARHGNMGGETPEYFLQHRVPKVLASDYSPAVRSGDSDLEWCPPGHGDMYSALRTSGLLDALLAKDMRYAFVSNADNLGAVFDPSIPAYMRRVSADFLMEVTDRTPADRKGGHLARRKDGRLLLREASQCPPGEEEDFQNIARHRYFNTNNIWIDLPALADLLEKHGGVLPLSLIKNSKTLDPRDPDSPAVYQLESAMGAAVSLFANAAALEVPRSRFAPVKTTEDLLAVWSDAYVLTDDRQVRLDPRRRMPAPVIRLDPKYFGSIDLLRERFPHGPPSLIECSGLSVAGDVRFGSNVKIRGRVCLSATHGETLIIPDNTALHEDDSAPDPPPSRRGGHADERRRV